METGPVKKKPLFRIIRGLAVTILSLALLIVSAAFIIAVFYEKEVKNYIIGELNKQLNTKIILDPNDIHLSLIKDFPYASLSFEKVTALDAVPQSKKDTLFSAGSIALQFNIIDIFKKNYRIRKVTVDHFDLNIKVDAKGNDNYHFWKQSNSSDTSGFSFELDKFYFNDVRLKYDYKPSQYISSFLIRKAQFSGNMKGEAFKMDAAISGILNSLSVDSSFKLTEKPIELSFALNTGSPSGTYEFKDGRLKLASLEVTANGMIDEQNINLKIAGKDLDIASVLSLLPAKYTEDIQDFESEGNFYFESVLKGPYRNNSEPAFQGKFGIQNGIIIQNASKVKLENISASGSFLNSKTKDSYVALDKFLCTLSGGKIEGQFKLSDFKNPFLSVNTKANIDLEQLQAFLQIDTVESMTGKMSLNASVNGEIKKLKNFRGSGNAANIGAQGNLDLQDARIRIKGSMLKVDSLNTNFELRDNNIAVKRLEGLLAGNDFSFQGTFTNVLPYFFSNDQPLSVSASFTSKRFSLDSLLSSDNTASQTGYNLKINDNINAVLHTNIGKLNFRKFEATDLDGTLTFKDNKMLADDLVFSTMNGKVEASGLIDIANQKEILASCQTKLININITQMFSQLENFGEEVLTDKNVKGRINANIQFAAVMDSSLNIDQNKIYSKSDLTIENGELLNFGPFRELGDYIKKDKILSMFVEADEFSKKLDQIKFRTLKNTVEVRDRKIFIPAMEIKSSAMNIEFSGTHNFENIVDYKFNFFLSEVFTKKQKKEAEENAEFGVVENDGPKRMVFFSMTGPVDNPVIKYDWKANHENKKANLKKEKENLKVILKEEFGWFKKDSLNQKEKSKKEDSGFKIKWGEDEKEGKEEESDYK